MARLLVRTIDGENAQRYKRGDIVVAFDDAHTFGRMESLDVWEAEGRDPAQWPGGFAIISLTGLSVAEANTYLEALPTARRKYLVDLDAIERRLPSGERDTLRTRFTITRAWSEVRDLLKVRA